MTHGPTASLSPDEELTLLSVAAGPALPAVSSCHLARLVALRLVRPTGGNLHLTPAGEARMNGRTMKQSIEAPLSPHEELALRRVALGIFHTQESSPRHIERLRHLRLIESQSGQYRLTRLGKQRYQSLPYAVRAAL